MNVFLRKANIFDIQEIFEMSNEAREFSFNTEKIKYEDHREWFKNKISDNKCLFFVAYRNDEIIGQVRFDCKYKTAVVSISLKECFRGSGRAKKILYLALQFIKMETNIKKIKAYVKKDNIISNKFFKKCGFKFKIENKICNEFIFNLEEDSFNVN